MDIDYACRFGSLIVSFLVSLYRITSVEALLKKDGNIPVQVSKKEVIEMNAIEKVLNEYKP